MSRRRVATKREIMPDPKYGERAVAKFINMLMKGGKKSVAERIVYGALEKMEARKKGEPIELFKQALDNVRPVVEVKSRRVGGATYQIPVEVRPERSMALAMRWIVDASKSRSEKNMGERLAGELLDAADSRGNAMKKREDTHRMAEANKAFSHYRW
ncbi:MAG: 30S ribosomal protein S7 [Gammaproteobacteria bacterium]|nr:30S ribosomal protein S7 [Gammaproteobacteria bacterium]